MSLSAQCDRCFKTYTVVEEKAGKKLKCQCGGTVLVPDVAEKYDIGEDDFVSAPEREPVRRAPRPSSGGGDVSGLIPYKNPPALTGYYLSILSLIPCLGLAAGIPAIVLGVIGLSKQRKNPELKGSAHAWIAIILSSLTSLVWIGLGVLLIVVQFLK